MAAAVPHAGLPGTPFERTFVAVKPDGVQRGLVGEIVQRFEKVGFPLFEFDWSTYSVYRVSIFVLLRHQQKGFKVVGLKLVQASVETVQEHYAEHKVNLQFYRFKVFFFALVPFLQFAS
jgi:nucleoside-diphosphate kinase